jgi:peptidoglycan hydrolase CwlO-like protein
MAEPENHTLRLLQEIRQQGNAVRKDVESLSNEVQSLSNRVDSGFTEVKKRMDSLHQALNGESLLGR